MEFIEMPVAPKETFDKMISNDSLRVPFSANGPVAAGFRPMPIPAFSHGKSLSAVGMAPAPLSGSAAELSRRGMPFVTSGMSLKGTQMALVDGGNGCLGMMHLQVPGESGSSHQADELMEKGKRSRGEGGRGSRGGGISSRKRTRADSFTTSEAIPEGSLSCGGVASAGRATTGSGTRQLVNFNGEKAEKFVGRRQSVQWAKRGDKKQSQMATSGNDTLPQKAAEANRVPNDWSSGVLDIYGLRTRAMDVSRFMVAISLNDLVSGDFEVPSFSLKDNHEAKMEPEECFEQQINSVLHLLPTRPAMGDSHSSKVVDLSGNLSSKVVKNQKMMVDLERPLHVEEEDGVSRAGKMDNEMQVEFAPAAKLEAGADGEAKLGPTAVLPDGLFLSEVPSRFSVDDLPVHSVENFLRRLKFMPNGTFLSLIAQAGADGETSGSANNRAGGDIIDLCHKNGSMPPLLFSYPPVGPPMAENGRYKQRIWIQSCTAEYSGGKGAGELCGKEGTHGAGEDAINSPRSRWWKADGKETVQSPDAVFISTCGTLCLSPDQMGPCRISSVVNTTTSIKEEPRQVENAVGFSSDGNLNPKGVNSGGVANGLSARGLDGPESTHVNAQCDQQKGGGGALRLLESPASLAGPQEMDTSSDGLSKLLATTLAEVKQEKVEQHAANDPEEEGSGACRVPDGSRQELSLGLPDQDLKINFRSLSPPQFDSSSSLPACPSSPGAQAAAQLLCSIANSAQHPEQDKMDGEKERRRRVFQPYTGAPAQKAVKSIRVSNSGVTSIDGGREGRRTADGGSVPTTKALVSERRKSLSQVNDAPDRPSYSSPRNSSGGGISIGSRVGSHTGSRLNTLSVKLEKATVRESTKDSQPTNVKELVGRGSSSLPPLSHGGPPVKNGHKALKGSSYLHSTNSKGNFTAAASFSKVPAACPSQRVLAGGTSSRSSRTVYTGNSLVSHCPAPVPSKSSRQSIPESRQKTKSEMSGRVSKSSRD